MPWFITFANWIAQRGGLREIFRPGPNGPELYLRRYYIFKSAWLEIMIHRFYLDDLGPLHDHPWWSGGIILQNGYLEYVIENGYKKAYRRLPGHIGHRGGKSFHRVELMPGTAGKVWTLFITGKRYRIWGFLTDKGWITFKEMFKVDGTEVANMLPEQFTNGLFPKKINHGS